MVRRSSWSRSSPTRTTPTCWASSGSTRSSRRPKRHIKQRMSQPSAKKAGPKYNSPGRASLPGGRPSVDEPEEEERIAEEVVEGECDRTCRSRAPAKPGSGRPRSPRARERRGRQRTEEAGQHQDVRDHRAPWPRGRDRPDHRHRRDVLGGKKQRSSRKHRRPSRRGPSRRRSSRSRRTRSSRRAIRSRRTCRPTRRRRTGAGGERGRGGPRVRHAARPEEPAGPERGSS